MLKSPIVKIFLYTLIFGGLVVYWVGFSPNIPFNDTGRSVKIPAGASFEDVSDSLVNAGLVTTRTSFELLAVVTGWGAQLKPGYYAFEGGSTNLDILDRIRKGLQSSINVRIPAGARKVTMARILKKHLGIEPEDFYAALNDEDLAESLDTDTKHLFGYFLPNTYQFFWTTDAAGVISRMKRESDRFFTEERQEKADEMGLTHEEVIRMASIVQWEAMQQTEKPRIAAVYLNRIKRRMRLQADPTVQFALMEADGGPMRRLFSKDYKYEHPYNTYLHSGLPPGPVNNPDARSIDAVLNAESHNYLYFVANGSGTHTFTRTLSEHKAAARAYLRMMRQRRRDQRAEADRQAAAANVQNASETVTDNN